MSHIDFEAKTDRELLVLTAQRTNDMADHLATLNDTLAKHEQRITVLETPGSCKQPKLRFKLNWQAITVIALVLALTLVSVGTKLGWW